MKKSFPDEKGTKKGVKEFLDKKGFYIVLLLCIAVVAGTAVFVTTRNATLENPEYEAKNLQEETGDDLIAHDAALNQSEKIAGQETEDTAASAKGQETDIGSPATMTNADDKNAVKPKEEESKKEETKKPSTPAKSTKPKPANENSATPSRKQSFQMPVIGEISLEYAVDKLVYSKTLEEWRAHPGVDIAADRGTPVKAVADGVVCEVRNDKFYGISVVIDHGDNLKTVYRNLASDETVVVNQKVKQDEIIGSIGNTAMDESSEQAHLHFEVLKDGENVDPMTYLPKTV